MFGQEGAHRWNGQCLFLIDICWKNNYLEIIFELNVSRWTWWCKSVVLNVGSMSAHQRVILTFLWPALLFFNIYFANYRLYIELKLTHFVVSWYSFVNFLMKFLSKIILTKLTKWKKPSGPPKELRGPLEGCSQPVEKHWCKLLNVKVTLL